MLVRNQSKKATKILATPKPQVANVIVPPEEITKKVNEVIAKYVDTSASNVYRPNASNAIAIQDLVKRLNGSLFKSYINFFSSIKNDGRYIKI